MCVYICLNLGVCVCVCWDRVVRLLWPDKVIITYLDGVAEITPSHFFYLEHPLVAVRTPPGEQIMFHFVDKALEVI